MGHKEGDFIIALDIAVQDSLLPPWRRVVDFASLVEDRLLKHSLLEGLVYDTVSTGGLVFAASVSYPQSDLYVPIRLVVTFDGKVSMQRIDQLEDDSSLPAEP